MEEPFDRQPLILSALWSGVGQLVRGQTNKGLLLLGVGTVSATLGGVTGLLIRVLTFGRVKIGPRRLNPLALVWLGTYLYNLYDAYNLAAGAGDDDDDLFEYEEYEPQEATASAGATNGAAGAASATRPSAPAQEAPAAAAPPAAATSAAGSNGAHDGREPGDLPVIGGRSTTGQDLANIGPSVAALDQGAAQIEAGGPAVGQGHAAANTGAAGTNPPPPEDTTGAPHATTAGPHSMAAADRTFGFSGLGIPWDQGVTKAQLLDMLGDEEQIQGVFGHYLPSDRVFHSEQEVLTLIPVQAWQDAQGKEWTGGDMPGGDTPSGYLDSAAGRLPPGETSQDMQ